MNNIDRKNIVEMASSCSLKVQEKVEGEDLYVKCLMFTVPSLTHYLFISKETGIKNDGSIDYLQVVVHPDEYRSDLEDTPNGIEEMINRRTGKNLFASSNYRGYPVLGGANEPSGKCYKVRDLDALGRLFEGLCEKQRYQGVLQDIRIANFKGISDEVRIELKPITLLFGPNSAGKSTILHALLYAKEILSSYNLNPDRTELGGESIDLGGFQSFVYGHLPTNVVRLSFGLDLSKTDLESGLTESEFEEYDRADQLNQLNIDGWISRLKKMKVEFGIGWSDIAGEPFIRHIRFDANDEKLSTITATQGETNAEIEAFSLNHSIFHDGEEELDADVQKSLFEKLQIDDANQQSKFDLPIRIPVNNFKDLSLDAIGDEHKDDSNNSLINIGLKSIEELVLAESRIELDWANFSDLPQMFDYPTGVKLGIESVISSLLVGSIKTIQEELNRSSYLGPLRTVPDRHFQPLKTPDRSRWANGTATWDELYNGSAELIDQANSWLLDEDKLDTSYFIVQHKYKEIPIDDPISIALQSGRVLDEDDFMSFYDDLEVKKRLYLVDGNTGIEVYPQDLGVGISQVLPVVIAALTAKDGVFMMEQPELHIHPGLQISLGDLFIESIQETNIVYLLETHSEHLLLRLLKRIRQTTDDELPEGTSGLFPRDIGIYFIEKSQSDETTVTQIRVDEDGEFTDRWPRGFFRERSEELF